VWAAGSGAAHAATLAVLLGLAAAATLAVELLVLRAGRQVDEARAQIAKGLDVRVRVVRGDEIEEIDAALVKPGECALAEAGEVLGIDGTVVAGEAQMVPWLGAAIETTKREGDAVVAGARVASGALKLTVTWAGAERAWARLALSPSLRVDVTAPIARTARALVERGAPIAAAVAGAAAYANGAPAAEIAATACAAALACAGPRLAALVGLAHAEGHVQALTHGIVYKDAAGFDRAGRTDVAVVCSRGTVLMGEPEIVALEPLAVDASSRRGQKVVDEGRLLALAAGAETASTHPFAAAILRGARARGHRPENVRNATAHAGLGVTALASSGERLVVGSRALLLQEKVSIAVADARVSELEAQGRSVMLVALAGRLVGLVALQDGLRSGARPAVQRLLDTRVEPVLLSGEARETCETIGRALDIDHVRPEVLPADRGAEVRALGEGGHVVAVLGHPSTDDGALGAAEVSIALSSAGSSPGEWTVQLASDDVRDAALALSIAHATRDRARRVLAFGLVPPAAAVLAIGFGLAPLVVAPIAALAGAVLASRAR
jgi:cation transport ATPase